MQGYNCEGSIDSSYGASAYSTCGTASSVGAPDTGFFQPLFASGSLEIALPLISAVLLAVIATAAVKRRKKRAAERSIDA